MLDSYEIVGMCGVVIVLVAYVLLNIGVLNQYSLRYQWMNILGALMILFSLIEHWNIATFFIEVAWIVISLIGVIKIWKKRLSA